MKLEMGESLLYSWLKHVKNCQIVQTNWKASQNWDLSNENKLKQIKLAISKYFEKYHDKEIYKLIDNKDPDHVNTNVSQILKQAEIDVLGISLDSVTAQNIYAVDVAFHEYGLNYGKDTVQKIIKKCVRTAMCLYGYFDIKKATIIFATPKASPKQLKKLKECIEKVQSILSDSRIGCDFTFEVIANDEFKTIILDPVIDMDIEDTSELFVRSVKLLQLFKDITDKPNAKASRQVRTRKLRCSMLFRNKPSAKTGLL